MPPLVEPSSSCAWPKLKTDISDDFCQVFHYPRSRIARLWTPMSQRSIKKKHFRVHRYSFGSKREKLLLSFFAFFKQGLVDEISQLKKYSIRHSAFSSQKLIIYIDVMY